MRATALILYATPLSSFSTKVRIALAAKGLAVEERMPEGGSYRSVAHRALAPSGQVPVLVDREFILTESDAIIEYIEEEYPEPSIMPGDQRKRAIARSLSRFHDFTIDPPLRRLFAQLDPGTRDTSAAAADATEIQRRLDQLELLAAPDPYLAGGRLSLADCAYPASLALIDLILPELGRPVHYGARIAAWRAVLERHPAVAGVMHPYRATASAWVATKLQGR
jgi:glutathione S-transferase